MALTITPFQNGIPEDKWGKCKANVRTVSIGVYATGGLALSPSVFGFKTLAGVSVIAYDTDAAPFAFRYNSQTGKLMVYGQGGALGTEVTNATDLSAVSVTLLGYSWA